MENPLVETQEPSTDAARGDVADGADARESETDELDGPPMTGGGGNDEDHVTNDSNEDCDMSDSELSGDDGEMDSSGSVYSGDDGSMKSNSDTEQFSPKAPQLGMETRAEKRNDHTGSVRQESLTGTMVSVGQNKDVICSKRKHLPPTLSKALDPNRSSFGDPLIIDLQEEPVCEGR